METKEILKNLRKAKGLTLQEVAEKSGVSYSAYQKYELGAREIGAKSLAKLADFYGVTTDYLLGRDPTPPNPLSQLTEEELEQKLIEGYLKLPKSYRDAFLQGLREAVAECYHIPVEDVTKTFTPQSEPTIMMYMSEFKVSAGKGYDFFDDYEHWERIPVLDTPEARKADYCLMIEGDSMEPKFSNGDVVLVKKQDDVDIGEIGIFIVDDAGYIKKRGQNRLISLNSEYDDIVPNEFQEVHCVGKVIGKAGKFIP